VKHQAMKAYKGETT